MRSSDMADESIKRGKALAEVTAPEERRLWDEEASGAFVLAIKIVLNKKVANSSITPRDLPYLEFSKGCGLLRNGETKHLFFYLHDGYLIVKLVLGAPVFFPYIRNNPPQVLNFYTFSAESTHQSFNEVAMAEQLVALVL